MIPRIFTVAILAAAVSAAWAAPEFAEVAAEPAPAPAAPAPEQAAPEQAAPESQTVAQAAPEAVQQEPEATLSDPQEEPTVADILDKEYEDWLKDARERTKESCKKLGRDLNSTQCDIDANIITGESVVAVPMTDPRWANARQLSYMDAMNKALGNYALQQNLNNQAQMLSKQLMDDNRLEAPSRNAQAERFEDATPGKVEQLLNKVYAVGEGYLDKQLRDLKVDPAKFERQPIEVKKKLFEDSIKSISKVAAIAETAGMVPIQTFYGKDADGKYGVRAVFSTAPSRIRLVRQMLRDGANIPPDPKMASKKTLAERFKLKGELMSDMLGTRLVWDKQGYPVLLAFGQSSVGVPRNNPTFAQRQQVARTAARNSAMNMLTFLLNSSSSIESSMSEQAGVTSTQSMVVDANNNAMSSVGTEEAAKMYLDQTIDTKGRISNFEGVKTFHNWSYRDKDSKQYIVGTVLIWSPLTAQETRAQKDALAKPLTAAAPAAQPAKPKAAAPKEVEKSKRAMESDNYVF